ncbi:MAG: hypothetical protein ACJ8EP_05365 [Sphingomicrobium sp.]|jgi:hypothetical protein
MRVKAIGILVVLVLSVALFSAIRNNNRADAAAGNCYTDAKGPSSPTICQ